MKHRQLGTILNQSTWPEIWSYRPATCRLLLMISVMSALLTASFFTQFSTLQKILSPASYRRGFFKYASGDQTVSLELIWTNDTVSYPLNG
ncbi:hypothetical protein GBAR_LOCUS30579, partial [Geodia barretti]